MVWLKTLEGNDDDYGSSITQTLDGGYAITGMTMSNDGFFNTNNYERDSTFVVKLNPNGNIQWIQIIGGNNTDVAISITASTTGGIVVTGSTRSSDGDFMGLNPAWSNKIYVVKLDSEGNI